MELRHGVQNLELQQVPDTFKTLNDFRTPSPDVNASWKFSAKKIDVKSKPVNCLKNCLYNILSLHSYDSFKAGTQLQYFWNKNNRKVLIIINYSNNIK